MYVVHVLSQICQQGIPHTRSSGGYAPGQGVRGEPPEAERYLKIKWAILRSGFDYLIFWYFHNFNLLLLTCYVHTYAANAETHIER